MLGNPERAIVEFRRLSVNDVQQLLRSATNVVHFIRHQGTLELLQQLLGRQLPSGGSVYTYQPGDIIVAVILATPQRGQEAVTVRVEDVVFYLVSVQT